MKTFYDNFTSCNKFVASLVFIGGGGGGGGGDRVVFYVAKELQLDRAQHQPDRPVLTGNN